MSAGVRFRRGMASRAVAATAGGYAVAALVAAVFSIALPAGFSLPRSESVMTGTFAAFLIFAMAVIWVFAARTALRAWVGLAVVALPLGGLLFALTRAQ